jgi:D-lactate dehydrogenase (cytochrome)
MGHTIRARPPRDRVEPPGIDRSSDALAGRLEDAAHFPGGHAEGIARPRSENEVAALLRTCASVLPIGAQSSVTGGATPAGGVLLSTDRLTALEPAGPLRYRAGAGVPLDTLQARLAADGCWYAPAPTYTGAFVGGVIATNAAGAATFKYGTTRQWIDALTIVLPCGDVLDLERGAVRADADHGFEIACAHGTRRFRPGRYAMPHVPKCSAGYYASEEMDLIDLFIGSEGTLGVIVDAVVRVLPAPGAAASALISCPAEAAGLAVVHALRDASRQTWSANDPLGIDVSAIEHLDRRCLDVLREDGVDRAQSVTIPADTELLLLVQLDLPAGTTAAAAYEAVAGALEPGAPDGPLTRFCRVLAAHGVLDSAELAAPGDVRRAQQFLMLREGAPVGVNRRVGDARRRIDDRIDKTAADMIVPFDRFDDMMAMYRAGYTRRGLDYAIWGHISDGNVHPNVIPRSFADVVAGREAILEFGREVVRMGGSPLAEHGVGRSSLKQALLRLMYDDAGLDDMRAIKAALDPDWKLAPGVLFSRT